LGGRGDQVELGPVSFLVEPGERLEQILAVVDAPPISQEVAGFLGGGVHLAASENVEAVAVDTGDERRQSKRPGLLLLSGLAVAGSGLFVAL
jgi:hypothetical protein